MTLDQISKQFIRNYRI